MFRNLLVFQLGWWATACLVAGGYPWHALVICLVFVGVHLCWYRTKQELAIVVAFGFYGYILDSTMALTHLIKYQPDWILPTPHPWLLGLWLLFATTINHSLAWIFKKRYVAIVLGAVFGPLTYYFVATKFAILSFSEPLYISLPTYVVLWMIYMMAALKHLPTLRRIN